MPAQPDLTKLLKSGIRKHGVPGATVAVYRNGQIESAAAGILNVDTSVEVTTDSVFQIGSIGKLFTATLIMQLVEERQVDIDAPVRRYLPDFAVAEAEASAKVTLRHLLCHTSGIEGDFIVDSGRGDDCVAKLQAMGTMLPQLFPPGEHMSYCNFGYGILGRVIEVLTGQTFDVAIKQRIFDRLGMRHVVALPEDTIRFRCAIGHVPDPKQREAHIPAPLAWAALGLKGAGSGIGMSIGDLMKFVDMHVRGNRSGSGKVLRRATARAMQRRQVRLPRHTEHGIDGWGIGWTLLSLSGKRVLGHDGSSLIGQYGYLRVLPEKQLAVALFANGGDSASLYETMFKRTFEPLGGVTMATLPESDDEIEIEPERYVGEYENLTGRFVIDSNRQGLEIAFMAKPVLSIPGPSFPLTPLRFIDRNTARFASGNHVLDSLPIIFPGNDRDSPDYLTFALRVFPRL